MNITDIADIAAVGAFAATTIGVTRSIVSRHLANKPHISIDTSHHISPSRSDLVVDVVNRGPTTEFVRAISIQSIDRTQVWGQDPHNDTELKPRARFTSEFDIASLPKRPDGYVAVARLASGAEIVSPVRHLIAEASGGDAK